MWRYYSYDVWGNAEEGYDVNDVFRTSTTVDLPRNAHTKEIFDAFDVTRGIVDTGIGDGDIIYLERERDGKPMGEFRFDEDTSRRNERYGLESLPGFIPPPRGRR